MFWIFHQSAFKYFMNIQGCFERVMLLEVEQRNIMPIGKVQQ